MKKMNQIQNDEIDLFELLATLWGGKWIISTFLLIAVLLGSGFLFVKDSVYESKVIYSVDIVPPFYENEKVYENERVLIDFEKKFYSIRVFKDWKESSGNTLLLFEDFNATEIIDGFVLSKNEGEQLATLRSKTDDYSFVLIKTNQLRILNDFFRYTNYINEALKNDYVVRARDQLKIIKLSQKDSALGGYNMFETILLLERFVLSVEKGTNVLRIQNPTIPEKVSPNSLVILVISVVLGGMMGAFITLARSSIRKREEQLDEV